MHVLPHYGGGGEKIVDQLIQAGSEKDCKFALSLSRSPLGALCFIASRYPRLAKAAAASSVIHLLGDATAILTLPLIVVLPKPVVISTQGLHLLRRCSGRKRRAVERLLRNAIARSFCTVCSSQAEHAELSCFADSRKLKVIYNGVNSPERPSASERTSLRRSLGLEADELVILFLGQLEARKDPMTAVRAVESARDKRARIVLLIAGEGPLNDELRQHEGPGIRLLGFRNDAQDLLKAADVFVMPSYREGLSLAVLEAMSFGLATVVSDGSGNPEAVGDSGIIVRAGDAQGFEAAFHLLSTNSELRTDLGKTARQRVEENFGHDRFINQLLDVFQSAVLSSKG